MDDILDTIMTWSERTVLGYLTIRISALLLGALIGTVIFKLII